MNYSSIKNTAKNGRLIRAEVRELVLSLVFVNGFIHNDDNKLNFNLWVYLDKYLYTNNKNPNLNSLQKWIAETLRYHYKHSFYSLNIFKNADKQCCIFEYCNKFRIYNKRLTYGQKHEYRLRKNTMQYFWTSAPLTLWFSLFNDSEIKEDYCLDFKDMAILKRAYDIEENMREISSYVSNVCKISNTYNPEKSKTKLFFTLEDYQHMKELCELEALRLKQKFYDGCYINLSPSEMTDIKRGYNYGKKAREKITSNICRKTTSNQISVRKSK